MSETMTGAQIVLKALQDQGVEHIFGYPGGAVLPIYDEIFSRCGRAYSRAPRAGRDPCRGRLCALYRQAGRCVGYIRARCHQCGDGLTDALMDSIPMVCITGQVATHLIGNDAFQEPTRWALRGPAPSIIIW